MKGCSVYSSSAKQWVLRKPRPPTKPIRKVSVKQPKTIIGVRAPALPSFPTFYFHLRAFSMQRARLSRSLEQARATMSFTVSFVLQ